MNDLQAILKKNGWSDDLLASIERVSKIIPPLSLGPNVATCEVHSIDLQSLSISPADVCDRSTLEI